uniref:DNA-damage-inducible protein J n=1 Tax=Candidatus Kentrum sp. FM TaxID=2126340 RepID=A0A450TCX4_9GAMM|nr:MAG: DNA-damage-inducible protein J [Candidatus Kentron sp. FM]VFK16198.1 MAG: DNA-damage-inducible protein J [Candidatus Kentron sp. FM]
MGLTVSDALGILLTRIAHEKALPLESEKHHREDSPRAGLTPNAETIAAMQQARRGDLETVTLDELQAVLDADD